jgi:hypothetical protein
VEELVLRAHRWLAERRLPVGGTLERLQALLAAGFPVIVEKASSWRRTMAGAGPDITTVDRL